MWLEAIITREDFAEVLGELLPVKIHFDKDESTERWIRLDRARSVTLVPDEGLRITCPAQLMWSIAGMEPSVTIDELTVLLRPEVVEKHKGGILEFNLEIDELDIGGVPSVLCKTISSLVNEALATRKLVWDFTKTLTRSVHMPETFELIEALTLDVVWGKRRIGADAVVLVVSFKIGFTRTD